MSRFSRLLALVRAYGCAPLTTRFTKTPPYANRSHYAKCHWPPPKDQNMYTLSSRAKSTNKEFAEHKRKKGTTNIDWLRSHLQPDRAAIVLLGGTDLIDFRLRIAQSHLRNDLTPSHWSHVALLGESKTVHLETASLGKIVDYLMPNYGDFSHISGELGKLAEAGLPVVLITGDVHWGRVAAIRDAHTGRESIFEIISSPTSLASSVGKDQLLADP